MSITAADNANPIVSAIITIVAIVPSSTKHERCLDLALGHELADLPGCRRQLPLLSQPSAKPFDSCSPLRRLSPLALTFREKSSATRTAAFTLNMGIYKRDLHLQPSHVLTQMNMQGLPAGTLHGFLSSVGPARFGPDGNSFVFPLGSSFWLYHISTQTFHGRSNFQTRTTESLKSHSTGPLFSAQGTTADIFADGILAPFLTSSQP